MVVAQAGHENRDVVVFEFGDGVFEHDRAGGVERGDATPNTAHSASEKPTKPALNSPSSSTKASMTALAS